MDKDKEAIIVEIRKTLKRNRKALAEIQRNNNETLKRSQSKASARNNEDINRFSASGSVQEPTTIKDPRSFYRSVDLSSTLPNHSRRFQVTPDQLNESKRKAEGRNSSQYQERLKEIVFRTLDTFFRIPSSSSKSTSKCRRNTSSSSSSSLFGLNSNRVQTRPGNTHQVGLDTLKRLSAYDDESTLEEVNFKEEETTLTSSFINTEEEEGDDDKSWIYVGNVLNVRQVTMSESDSLFLEHSTIPMPPPDTNEDVNYGAATDKPQPKRLHYKKRTSNKENDMNKMRRRVQEKKSIQNLNLTPPQSQKVKRPDSPVAKKEVKKFLKASSSLPNLTEQSLFESSVDLNDNSFADCSNTNSFKRGAMQRPSSTMKKSLIADDLDLEEESILVDEYDDDDDNDLCSSTSSFTSFVHIPSSSGASKPSALLQDFQVHPITVPIEPIKCDQPVKVLSEEEFNRRFDAYELVKKETTSTTTAVHSKVEIEEAEGIKVVSEAFEYLPSDSEENKSCSGNKENEGVDNASNIPVPSVSQPPPPLPPPMPPSQSLNTTGTLRSLLPLPVYTKLPEGNSIFKNMTPHKFEEEQANNLKKNFQFCKKSTMNKGLKVSGDGKQRSKLKLNLEIFLKSWGIVDITSLLECISTMNPTLCEYDKGCFAALAQIIPNGVNVADVDALSNYSVDRFLQGLHEIKRIDQKLRNIQFSLDFPELHGNISASFQSIIDTCHDLTTSEKFTEIIQVVMGILTLLSGTGGGQNERIQGFDILSLNRLATKVSPSDESTTLLHFLIEYIVKNPSKCDAVDFHLEFGSLANSKAGLSRISLDELEMQVKEWRKNLMSYKKELDSIGSLEKLDYAQSFYDSTMSSVENVIKKLDSARKAFNECKEHYGLQNSEIKETQFFESIAQFIENFRKIHLEILAKEERARRRSQKISPMNTNIIKRNGNGGVAEEGDIKKMRRRSCGPALLRNKASPFRSPPGKEKQDAAVDELDQCLHDLLEEQNNMKRLHPRQRKNPF